MTSGERIRLVPFPDARFIVRMSPVQYLAYASDVQVWRVTSGFHTVQCLLVLDAMIPAKQAQISSGLLGRLHMEETAAPAQARLYREEIHIGPTIGILCNPRWDARASTVIASTQLPALEKLLLQAERSNAVAYLFRVEDVDFQNLSVRAYMKSGARWRSAVMPLPDVVYDQLISRRRERSSNHAKLRERLSKMYGSNIFNDGFFDKWQVHEWLSKDVRLVPHLPRTIRYKEGQEASQFLRRHTTVYLKPVHGSLGLGIVRVASQSDGSVAYEVKRPNQSPISGRASSPAEMVKSFRKRVGRRPYLLQQGIPLATIDGRPFDIRILLQRDGTGEWRRTKAFARVTQLGDITSNLSSGGEAVSMNTILSSIFVTKTRRQACRTEIRRVCRWVADAVEQQAGKKFGELGVDLGMDQSGHVWVIEVNSKPWKSPTTEKGSQKIVDLAFERPIAYAIWLAEHR